MERLDPRPTNQAIKLHKLLQQHLESMMELYASTAATMLSSGVSSSSYSTLGGIADLVQDQIAASCQCLYVLESFSVISPLLTTPTLRASAQPLTEQFAEVMVDSGVGELFDEDAVPF